jgi:DDE_Tnp_1-associated
LLEVLAQVPDPRDRSGKRHPLAAILGLAVAATLCGAKGYGAIAEWGRNYGIELAQALGITREKTPCAATFYHLFRRLDRAALEAVLAAWAESLLAQLPPAKGTREALAIDGKTLRGSQQQGALDVHLLSVLSHRLGVTLFQQAVSDKTNEISAIQQVLASLVLEGRVVTVDAMLCQRKVAQTLVSRGGTTS